MRGAGFRCFFVGLVLVVCWANSALADPATDAAVAEGLANTDAAESAAGRVDDGAVSTSETSADLSNKPPEISWRLANPFRFFEDPKHTEMHRGPWLSLSEEEKKSPILSAERQLGARHSDGWASEMYRKTCWDNSKNRHICLGSKNFMDPRSHKILARIDHVIDAETVTCLWQFSPGKDSKKSKSQTKPRTIEKPCNEAAEIELPYPAGGDLSVAIGGQTLASAQAKVVDLLVVGMGDSFASGEGNPDVPVRFSPDRATAYGVDKPGMTWSLAGFPARVGPWRDVGDAAFLSENARWLDQACHRSLYSHQLRAALQLAIENPHRAVTYVGLACSGAEVTDGLFLRYKGHEWVPSPPDLSQISAAAVAQCGDAATEEKDYPEAYHLRGKVPELANLLVLRKCDRRKARKIDLVFVSIGGNDIGFSRLVANAVLADKSTLKKLGGWFGRVFQKWQAEAKLKKLKHRYKSLKRAFHNVLHVPWKQSDRIILTGYPGLAFLDDGQSVCPDGRAGMEVVADYKLSEKRVREGHDVAEKLNDEMRTEARRHGWSYAESHRSLFNGRGVCAGLTDNVQSIADDLRLPRKIDGKWVPYNPSEFRAYVPRQRWFRTPNDAFMTGNFHVSQTKLPKALRFNSLGVFQLVLASTYSGAYHPTAEGQAAIADALTDEARKVLAKYGQDPKWTEAAAVDGDVMPIEKPSAQ